MSQHDLTVANASGAVVRADINDALQALGTLQSGASAPATTFAYMLWADTSAGLLKQRDGSDSSWITLGTLAQPYLAAILAAFVGLSHAANKLPYSTGAAAMALADLSSFGRSLIDDADAAAARTTLSSLAISDCPAKYKSNLSVIPNSIYTSVTITADEIALVDSSGNVKRFASVNQGASILGSGAGGLDTGAEAAATNYYLWLIGKSDGTVAGLLSASSSSPTLPSGYTYKRLVGQVYNDASSNFVARARRDDLVWMADPQAVFTAHTLTTSFVEHALPASIPQSGITELMLEASVSDVSGSVLQIVKPSTELRYEVCADRAVGGDTASPATGGYCPVQLQMCHLGAGTVYAKAFSSAAADYQNLHVAGYRLPV